MMKYTFYILLFLIAAAIGGCSDNENKEGPTVCPPEPQYPDVATITISENIYSDGGTVKKQDTYSFTNNRLVNHTTAQEFNEQSLSNEVRIAYSEEVAGFTDGAGNKAIYVLDNNGYAQKCVYQMHEQRREYDFFYTQGHLTKIEENIDGEPFSSVELQYNSGNLQAIHANGQTILCQTGDDINTYNLPCIALYDIHPLSLHIDAIYARILGRQSLNLVTRTAPKGNDKEWTDYIYQLDGDNKPTALTASTTSTGTIYDNDGTSSEVTRADRRTLLIEIK